MHALKFDTHLPPQYVAAAGLMKNSLYKRMYRYIYEKILEKNPSVIKMGNTLATRFPHLFSLLFYSRCFILPLCYFLQSRISICLFVSACLPACLSDCLLVSLWYYVRFNWYTTPEVRFLKILCARANLELGTYLVSKLWNKVRALFEISSFPGCLKTRARCRNERIYLRMYTGRGKRKKERGNHFLIWCIYKWNRMRAQRLINLEIPVLVRSLKSSNVELG